MGGNPRQLFGGRLAYVTLVGDNTLEVLGQNNFHHQHQRVQGFTTNIALIFR